MVLEKRYNVCYDRYGRSYNCNSNWNSWGRWVALAVILVVAFLAFFLCSCASSRRRRRMNKTPFYGTGWAGRTGHAPAEYNPNQQYQQAPPNYNQANGPNYNQSQGQGQNQSYFGGGRDVEMQSPNNDYQPPAGPPPAKR